MQQHTLPFFRIAGLKMNVPRDKAVATAQNLRQAFVTQHIELKAFSTTLYAVHQYQDNDTVNVVVGKLVATDDTLPENLNDAWIAPQNYVVFDAPSITETWQHIQQQTDLPRRFLADFETYPTYGSPKIYVGVVGEMDINEETLNDDA